MTARSPRIGNRRLEYTPIDDLIPAVNNPKLHADLADSFDQFGYMDPVTIDERTGRLVGGHGRLETLQRMRTAGHQPPDGVIVRGGSWCVPVTRGWSSRDDDHAAAALVALNRYTELGGWDHRELATMLDRISDADTALLTSAGYSDKQLAKLLADLPDIDTGEPARDPVTPPDQRPAIQHKCPNCGHTWNTR